MEMTIEEKAKAYDEALEKVKKYSTDKYGTIIGMKPSDIFQELADSNDEKIRQAVNDILHIDNEDNRYLIEKYGLTFSDVWEWIKNQHLREWTNKDEDNLKECLTHLKEFQQIVNPANESGESDLTIWAESLRKRFCWKPSSEQMINLINVRNYVAEGSGHWGEVLDSLIEDLKKL